MQANFPAQGERLCRDAAETQKLGAELGAVLQAGDLVVLDGPLGAGKTTFALTLPNALVIAVLGG